MTFSLYLLWGTRDRVPSAVSVEWRRPLSSSFRTAVGVRTPPGDEAVVPFPKPIAEAAARRWVPSAETAIVVLASVALFAIYAWASNYWVDLADEGYFMYLASRVHQGDLPYRDFDTYYTPGVFYLYAAVFDLFGVSIVPVRVLMSGVRVICALLMYGLARRLVPPAFALLPFLMVAAVDPVPVFPEPHPAWTALLATLLTIEAIVRHAESGRLRWIALAGAASAFAFAFKQNVGAFDALAVGGYLLSRPRDHVGWLMLGARWLYGLVVGVIVTSFLWPAMNGLLAVTIWLPVLVTIGLLLTLSWRSQRPQGWLAGLGALVGECALAGAMFVIVTVAWLVPLALALGPRETPWGLFVGAVNQGALVLPLEPPPRATHELALWAIWLPVAVALGWRTIVGATRGSNIGMAARESRLHWAAIVGVAVALSLLIPSIPIVTTPWESLLEDPSFDPWLTYLDLNFQTLYLYLPVLAAWGAVVAVSSVAIRDSRGRVPQDLKLETRNRMVPWYLLAGVLAALAMYPRSDTLHAMFAGPPLFVVGAWVLWCVHRGLIGRAHVVAQMAVFAALLVVPVLAVAPHAYWRLSAILWSDPRADEPPPYVPLGLERAPVLAPKHVADNVRGAVEFIREGTPLGEPFLAFPAAPLFNFLADRPNPTRFDHFFPYALTPDDLAEVIRRLDTTQTRYVLWDHGGVVYWGLDPQTRNLTDYIWRCYEQVANFPPYLILERRC